jgi:RHS repeat-associated protein
VLALSDGTRATISTYSYDPYGNTSQVGAPSSNPFEYVGRENDGTGLYYNRARYYMPNVGRFISQDPIGLAGGLNVYAYANGLPTSFRDPYGLTAEDVSNAWGWMQSNYPEVTNGASVEGSAALSAWNSSGVPSSWQADGYYPGGDTIYIANSFYTDNLNEQQQADLTRVLAHEALHRYYGDLPIPFWRNASHTCIRIEAAKINQYRAGTLFDKPSVGNCGCQ